MNESKPITVIVDVLIFVAYADILFFLLWITTLIFDDSDPMSGIAAAIAWGYACFFCEAVVVFHMGFELYSKIRMQNVWIANRIIAGITLVSLVLIQFLPLLR